MSDQTTVSTEEQVAEKPAPSLSIQDLIQVVQFIQVASSRGAVTPAEMTQIGALYTRLVDFLEANGAVTRAPAQTEQKTQETPNA